MILHGNFRSSASYRVRIALNLKGLTATHVSHHLRKGEQRAADYLPLNPQGLVPTLVADDGRVLTQSLAIIEWLDEAYPKPPLLPTDAWQRARVRAFAQAIACDIHPIQNLKILKKIKDLTKSEDESNAWARAVNEDGLAACELMLSSEQGPFCFGTTPTLADLCLVPQLANARRFKADVSKFPHLLDIEAIANALPAFADAAPAKQADAE